MKITPVGKTNNIKYVVQNYDTDDNFPHQIGTFESVGVDIHKWFAEKNNYPETVISQIRNGTTLESILFEDLIYKTGSGFNGEANFLRYLEEISFKNTFKNSNDHLNKLGNIYIEVTTDEKLKLISLSTIQPHKCRLSKDSKSVIIYSDWKKFKKDKAITIPLYPKYKTYTVKGIKYNKAVYHIKNEVLGFDHYGINEKMTEALLLNEKEHRRNNWQLSQIKRGFKRDFFMVTDFPMTKKEKDAADKAFNKVSGDDYAGGVENIEGENGKLIPAQSTYDFDYTKDDTSDLLFLKMGFPRSLIGIKSGAAFSVEQVESDYDQYLPKVENQQTFLLSKFSKLFTDLTPFNVKDWNVINSPPSIILQNYMQYMNDAQKNVVIEQLFTRYGLETPEKTITDGE